MIRAAHWFTFSVRPPFMGVTVQIPASTTNFGPGFDCLGAALQLYNWVQLDHTSHSNTHPSIVQTAAEAFFEVARLDAFEFRAKISGDVPAARGLGSSVTVRLGILLGLNVLAGSPLSRHQIFTICTGLEGHPDNTGAALFGGFVVVNQSTNRVYRFDVDPSITFVLLVPDFEVQTSEARAVLPENYARSAVVPNLAYTSQIAAAFASRQYGILRNAFTDQLHEPYRERFVPFLRAVLAAGQDAGAYGGFLSGSGSTIACVTSENASGVAEAMVRAAPKIKSTTLLLRVDNSGAQIT